MSRHPTSAVLMTLALGFGVGLLIGHMLGEPPQERLGRAAQMKKRMMDTLSHALPESVAKRFG